MKQTLKSLLLVLAAMLLTVSAYAQFTTSSMTGRITDENGEVLPGAAVVAVHTPSGSQYYAISNEEGYYTIQGMRPGGPYDVTVSLVGCQTLKVTDITLQLSETFSNDVCLKTDSELLQEVVVVASASKFSNEKTGASTNVSNRDIQELPNSDRSISALTKLSPYANGMSFAGSDGRSTNFTVDGANFNNNFGLSSSLPGGGTPISIDAIEEVQLVVAPYDVRQSNFVGGGINAITKSGTNTFKGTAYAYYNNQDLRGNKVMGQDLGDRKPESNLQVGATVGGPIVKDKLFFFVNFEYQKISEEVITYQASAEKQKVLEQIKQKLINDYGYDPGSYTDFPGGTTNMKILARLDWNISDAHKLSVRFNKTDNLQWNAPNENSCDDNFRNRAYNRASEASQPFSNNMYNMQNHVWSIAGELNSRFSDKVSNRLLVTYTDIIDQRGSNSSLFPHIDIMDGDLSSGSYVPYTSLGYELFTYNNKVSNRSINASDNISIYAGSHTVTAGLSYEYMMANNAYMRNATGYYRFASPEDFLAGNLPISTAITYGYNGIENPTGEVRYHQGAAYAQDEWKITKKFKLTYGIRADLIAFDNSTLMTNNAILAKSFGGRSIDTGSWPDTKVQISPRIGFNWDINGDKSVVLRGGTGFFQGRLPLVFFTNMPQNSGMFQNLVCKGDYSGKISNGELVMSDAVKKNMTILNGGKETGGKLLTDTNAIIDALGLPRTITSEEGYLGKSSDINGVDKNFRMPQIWKTSLAVDWKVPTSFPFSVTAEGMFNKTIWGVMLSNWNVNETSTFNTLSGPDNRKMYSTDNYYGTNSAYVLTNTTKGWGYSANVTVNMEPVKNLKIMAAYTHMESKEVSGMPGSNASSAYQGLPSVDGPNFAVLQRSRYVVPDKVMANIGYFIPWKVFHGRGLHIDAYYTASAVAGNCFVYSNDMNGDGIAYDLMYIPKDVNDVQIGTIAKDGTYIPDPSMAQSIMTFVNNDKYLSKHKGEYAEAYAASSPWCHRIDLRIAEDFAFKIGNTMHNFQLSASIDNLTNLLNSNWGVRQMSCYQTSDPTAQVIAPLKYEGTANGQAVYSMVKPKGYDSYPTENYTNRYINVAECWTVLFGIKYFFN